MIEAASSLDDEKETEIVEKGKKPASILEKPLLLIDAEDEIKELSQKTPLD